MRGLREHRRAGRDAAGEGKSEKSQGEELAHETPPSAVLAATLRAGRRSVMTQMGYAI
jgi:hypothetical protein